MNREEITAAVASTLVAARQAGYPLTPEPAVTFFTKGTSAGYCYPSYNEISFNELIARDNSNGFANVVIHEVVHLIVARYFPDARQRHGREFRQVSRLLGGDPSACHSFDVSAVLHPRKKLRFEARCKCRIHLITRKCAAHCADPFRQVTCNACGGQVRLTGNRTTIV